MAFRLKVNEQVPEALRRVVAEEIDCAAKALAGAQDGDDRDKAIHEARKSVKKIRSVLRLVQEELGDAYDAENKRFQAIGRQLSVYRDGTAVIEVFDSLRGRYKDDLAGNDLEAVRRGLTERKQAEEKAGLDRTLKGVLTTLRYAGRRVRTWPLEADGFEAIAGGFERTFRRGRNALRAARKNNRPETYHEWRKRVKDHWYHIRLLEDVWPAVMTGYERSLKDLQDWLGDDHNLAVLRDRISAEPALFGASADTDLVLGLIEKYQKELRDNSVALGRRIYADKPKRFRKRMARLWKFWPVQSASAQEEEDARSGKEPSQPEAVEAPVRQAPKSGSRSGHRHGGAAKTPRRGS